MDTTTSEKTIGFSDPLLPMFSIHLLKRRSLTTTSPLVMQHLSLLSLAAMGVFIFILSTLMQFIRYFTEPSDSDLIEIGLCGAVGGGFLIAFIRGVTLIVNRNGVERLLYNLEKLFPITKQDQLNHDLDVYVKATILRNNIITKLCFSSICGFVSKPILQSLFEFLIRGQPYGHRYPYNTWFPYEDNSFLTYTCSYTFHILISITAAFFLINEDFVFTTSVTYTCMYYRYLSKLLSEVDARDESRSYQKLKKLIRYQYALEELRNGINEVFSVGTFIGFTVMKITLCMFIFSIFQGLGVANVLPCSVSFLALIIPIFMKCTIGTDLYEASASLIQSLYAHNWHEGTPKYRKMIAIMMARANTPVLLQASQMNHIHMEYFKEVVIQTYQILTFLLKFSS